MLTTCHEGSVLNVTVSAPTVTVKPAPTTPEEALQKEEEEVARLKGLLDGFVATVTEQWKEHAPTEATNHNKIIIRSVIDHANSETQKTQPYRSNSPKWSGIAKGSTSS